MPFKKMMSNRKSLSKKNRFEVFKRDSFKCQYCGKVAPNVILEVDHIVAVAKGGSNDILNLITSCYECNRGKSDRDLDDDSVVVKQRRQLELLQERREQIELMFEWRKALHQMSEDTTDMVVSYIEEKIDKFSLNESGIKKIAMLTRKYELADILESIDISSSKYLRYDSDGNLTQDSAEEFINKIGGVLVNKNKPPIERKASYIKGICRNKFNYWNPQTGSILLNNYIKALRECGWSDERILEDLENELQPKTIECKNWSEWRGLIEKWTEDIKGWDQDVEHEEEARTPEYPGLVYPEGEVYVDDYVVHAIGMKYIDHIGVVITISIDQMPEKYRNPQLLSAVSDRNPEYYKKCILNAFDGKVLKAGNDYVLDLPLLSPLLSEYIAPDKPIKDFFIDLLEQNSDGYTTKSQESLGEAIFLSISCGPVPLPFVYES